MLNRSALETRSFTPLDQERFARLSGDWNPLHLDGVVSRQHLYGRPVVHGVHLVLWGLESVMQALPDCRRLQEVKARFVKPALVGEPLRLSVLEEGPRLRLSVVCGGELCADLRYHVDASPERIAPEGVPGARYAAASPEEPSWDDLKDVARTMETGLDAGLLQDLFPACAERLPADQVSHLLAVSRLVGMQCPGLHSLLAQIKLAWTGVVDGEGSLHYKTAWLDDRSKLLTLALLAPGVSGEVQAFVRQ